MNVDHILQKEVSRKQFLVFMLAIIPGVVMFRKVFSALTPKPQIKNDPSAYGGSSYGGKA